MDITRLIHTLFRKNRIEFGRIKLMNDRVEFGEMESEWRIGIAFGIERSLRIQLEEQSLDFHRSVSEQRELVLEESNELLVVNRLVFMFFI